MTRSRWVVLVGLAALVFGVVHGWSRGPCLEAWWHWDLVVEECPDGRPVVLAQVETGPLERGEDTVLRVRAEAVFPVRGVLWGPDGGGLARAAVVPTAVGWTLVGPAHVDHPVEHVLDCRSDTPVGICETTVPAGLLDGHYTLSAQVSTRLSDTPTLVDASLGFFSRARVHVLTDRPRYEPGDVVQFRALVLGQDGQGPLGDRVGRWQLRDPDARLVYETREQTDDWGVSVGDFPLAHDATQGTWTLRWETGADHGEQALVVAPFTLPRAELEAWTVDGWHAVGSRPRIQGRLRSLAGVPLADAPVMLSVRADPSWPLPLAWNDPEQAHTDGEGAFSIELDEVPDDLPGLLRLGVMLSATTPTGERVTTELDLVLSRDSIAVDGLTELGDGLVPELSNRVYLRVSDPVGVPLAHAEVVLRNAWDPRDPGRTLRTDADGVLAANVDPGQPVQVVVPPRPVRAPSMLLQASAVVLEDLGTLVGGAPDVAEALTEALAGVDEACGWWARADAQVTYGMTAFGGRVVAVSPASSDRDACLAAQLEGEALADGVYAVRVGWRRDPSRPRLAHGLVAAGAVPPRVTRLLEGALPRAEGCIQGRVETAQDPLVFRWSGRAGERSVRVARWTGEPSWPEERCIAGALSGLELEEEAELAAAVQGVIRLDVVLPEAPLAELEPQGSTTTAFEYLVTVEGHGQTTWRVGPGKAPRLRLRPEQVRLQPGEIFAVALLRGPDFSGELPAEIEVRTARGSTRCARTDALHSPDTHEGCPDPGASDRFVLQAPDSPGLVRLEAGGAVSMVYVVPPAGHDLVLSMDEAVYRPGRTATLTVQTGVPAVVSLAGVDASMGAIASLPEPDALARLSLDGRVRAPVLGAFDALALTSGAISGENAALATIQRLELQAGAWSEAPPVMAEGRVELDLDGARRAVVYEVVQRVRSRISGLESLDPVAYARIWDAEAAHVTDPFGRHPTLASLPDGLLGIADPRVVVIDASRLPEDQEPWIPFVRRPDS